MNIFITGTDTDVGKTVVAAGISAVMQSLGYNTGVYKPVQSGAMGKSRFLTSPDLGYTMTVDPNIKTKCSYNLRHSVAPALAAKLENVQIDPNVFLSDYEAMKVNCDLVIVEGAGGLLVPVYNNFMVSDLVKLLKLPVVIVAKSGLGTINHTLLTIQAAKSLGIKVVGVIINNYPTDTIDPAVLTAPNYIKELSGVNILGVIPQLPTNDDGAINPEDLLEAVINNVDLQKIFDIKIPKLSEF